MKIMQVTEAARKLGVSRQTIENWGKYGIIKIHKSGRTGKAHWVDANAVELLGSDLLDYEHEREKLKAAKEELKKAQDEVTKEIRDIQREVYIIRKFGHVTLNMAFYESIPTMLEELGIIDKHTSEIMRLLISGTSSEDVAGSFGITRARVAQIFLHGCRKSLLLGKLKDAFNENKNLKAELSEAKKTIIATDKKLMAYENAEISKDINLLAENDNVIKLLRTPLTDFELSVRTLNCLRTADIKTVGALIRHNRTDFLKFRNFGKKSLQELNNFIDMLNSQYGFELAFGMDIDGIYRKHVSLHYGEYEKENEQ